MAKDTSFPRFETGQLDEDPKERLTTYVGMLRKQGFESYSAAGRFFNFSHTTIKRYESGEIEIELGYIANLIRYNLEQFEEDPLFAEMKKVVLQDLNQILEIYYPEQKHGQDWDWDQVYHVADEFWTKRSKRRERAQRSTSLQSQQPKSNNAALRGSFQLPKRIPHFTNRKQELGWLLDALQPGRVVALCGGPGIGKSALGGEAIWQLHDSGKLHQRFPDGVFTYTFFGEARELTGDVLEDVVLEQITHHFGEKPSPTPEKAAERALAGRSVLLFLDGTNHLDNVQTVLSVSGHCGVLITSRRRSDAPAGLSIIRSLPHDTEDYSRNEAVALLQAWGQHRVQTDTAASLEICQRVAGHPLALVLIGSYLISHEQDASDYLEWLKVAPLSALDFETHPQKSIPLLIEHSLHPLPEMAQQALAVASLLALAPFDSAVIAAAMNISLAEAGQLLGKLVNLSLLERPRQRYQFGHALIRIYARQRMVVASTVVSQLVSHYLTQLEKASRQQVEGYEWLEQEHLHILAVLHLCKDRRDWKTLIQIVGAIAEFQDVEGHWTEGSIALAAALHASQQLGHRGDEAALLGYSGVNYRNRGQFDKAINQHRQALAIYEEIGDRHGQVKQLNYLGLAYRPKSEPELAIAYHQQALTLAREIGDRHGEANALGGLAMLYKNRKDDRRELVIPYFEAALAISQETKDDKNEGVWLANLGLFYEEVGSYEKAIEYYQQALPVARKARTLRVEAAILGNLGKLHIAQGLYGSGERELKAALQIQGQIGDLRGQANQLNNLGYLYFKTGHFDQALDHYHRALKLNQNLGRRGAEADVNKHLGEFYKEQRELKRAQEYFEEALRLYDSIDSREAKTVQKILDKLHKSINSPE